METLLDPNFRYPDLVATAEAMVAEELTVAEGCALARTVMGGEMRNTSVGRAVVIGPQGGGQRVMANLQAYANAHDQSSAKRWAAFLLMIEALLGLAQLDSDAAPLALEAALRPFDSCVRATGARCPERDVRFAVQAVDSLLANSACTRPELRARLEAARVSFANSAKPSVS